MQAVDAILHQRIVRGQAEDGEQRDQQIDEHDEPADAAARV